MSSTENFLAIQPVSDADREFWQFVWEHRDLSGEVQRRLREADRLAEIEQHNRAKQLRAAVRKIIRQALKGEVDRQDAAINISGEITLLFNWHRHAELDAEGSEEPQWFEAACEVAAEIVVSGLNFWEAQREVYAVLSERWLGVPSGIFYGVGVDEKAPRPVRNSTPEPVAKPSPAPRQISAKPRVYLAGELDGHTLIDRSNGRDLLLPDSPVRAWDRSDLTLIRPQCDGNGRDEGTRDEAASVCLGQIERADMLFASINEPNCFQTLIEIGFAHAQGVPIFLHFGPDVPDECRAQFWMAEASANVLGGDIRTALWRAVDMWKDAARMANSVGPAK
jgi:nucleoside 2-deoxyribosyltransferase